MAPDTDRPRRALIAGAISTGLALSLLFACAGTARALVDDRFTTRTQPASSLVMPFDQRSGHASFLIASNLAGAAAVSTHWSFWNEDCSNLGEVSICLTPNDTVVVDPGAVRSLDAANKSIDEPLDLAIAKDGNLAKAAASCASSTSAPTSPTKMRKSFSGHSASLGSYHASPPIIRGRARFLVGFSAGVDAEAEAPPAAPFPPAAAAVAATPAAKACCCG